MGQEGYWRGAAMGTINRLLFFVLGLFMVPFVLALGQQDKPQVSPVLEEQIAKKCFGLPHGSMVKCSEDEESRLPAAESKKVETKAENSLEEGKTIFYQYCYVCHGLEGKGNGPGAEY